MFYPTESPVNCTSNLLPSCTRGSEFNQQINYWEIKSMNDLPGEQWKELPGSEGYYVISNMGRVKCYDRTVVNKLGVSCFYKGKIMQQVVIRYPNKTVGDQVPELVTNVSFCGRRMRIRVARMVYRLFVADAAGVHNDDFYVVLHKNSNRYDNRAINLYAATCSEKTSVIYYNDRMHRVYEKVSDKTRQLIAAKKQKQVTAYNHEGECVGFFVSIKEASGKTGISESSIVAALKGKKMKRAGGFFWKYGRGEDKIDISFYYQYIRESRRSRQQPVVQFNLLGQPIKTYDSVQEAASQTGCHFDGISKVINQKAVTCYGFVWRKGPLNA